MRNVILHKPQSDCALRRRQSEVLTEALLPIPAAVGAASENIAPTAIRPIGAETLNLTGISLPVIFWPSAGRDVGLSKAAALKLPPIPAGSFPVRGEGFPFRFTPRSISASLFFTCRQTNDSRRIDEFP